MNSLSRELEAKTAPAMTVAMLSWLKQADQRTRCVGPAASPAASPVASPVAFPVRQPALERSGKAQNTHSSLMESQPMRDAGKHENSRQAKGLKNAHQNCCQSLASARFLGAVPWMIKRSIWQDTAIHSAGKTHLVFTANNWLRPKSPKGRANPRTVTGFLCLPPVFLNS